MCGSWHLKTVAVETAELTDHKPKIIIIKKFEILWELPKYDTVNYNEKYKIWLDVSKCCKNSANKLGLK